jgi:hypothetical protein
MLMNSRHCLAALLLAQVLLFSPEASGQTVANSSFETPSVGPVGAYFSIQARPSGAVWTFTGNGGIAANGSGFGFFHDNTPQGAQFAYLQGLSGGGASMSQSISGFRQDGRYAIRFVGSQRDIVGRDNTQNQGVTVSLDGVVLGTFQPVGMDWSTIETNPTRIGEGAHEIRFTVPAISGDATVLIDGVELVFLPDAVGTNGTLFRGLGQVVGGTGSTAYGISADGKVIVGEYRASSTGIGEAFRYLVDTNAIEHLQIRGTLNLSGTNDDGVRAEAVSSDGRYIVGTIRQGGEFGESEAFVWDRDAVSKIRILPVLDPALKGKAHAVSPDGKVVVGEAQENVSFSQHPFVWTTNPSSGVFQGSFLASVFGTGFGVGSANAVGGSSSDPEIGGNMKISFSGTVAPVSLNSSSSFTLPIAVSTSPENSVLGISTSGAHYVGTSAGKAFLYRTFSAIDLGNLGGTSPISAALDVSADGLKVVGKSTSASGDQAFLWDSNARMRSIRQILDDANVLIGGWTLQNAVGISDDGRVIVGTGLNPAGQTESWMAVIPPTPVVTSPLSVEIRAGRPEPFLYKVEASENANLTVSKLPNGLKFNSVTREITGPVPPEGQYTIQITATNAAGSRTVDLTVDVGRSPYFPSDLVIEGTEEVPLLYQLNATQAQSYSVSGEPPGLSMNTAGLLSGVPAAAGNYQMTVVARNGFGESTAQIMVRVAEPIVDFNNDATIACVYTIPMSFQVSGKVPLQNFSAVGLPDGLSINPSTGLISGTPALINADLNVVVTASAGSIVAKGTYRLTVTSNLIDPANPEARLGHGLRIQVNSVGGDWNQDSWEANVTVVNPSSTASVGGALIYGGVGSEETRFFNTISGNGSRTFSLSGSRPSDGRVYVKVSDNSIPQDSRLLLQFLDFPTNPPSGSVTESSSDISAPDFRVTTLTRVEVQGVNATDENTTRQYSVLAVASNGATYTPTNVQWSASPSKFEISNNGTLTVPSLSADENVTLTASVTAGGLTVLGSKVVKARDTTAHVSIEAAKRSARETAGPVGYGRFVISRSGSTALPLTLNCNVSGTASPGTDYQTLNSVVTIPAGNATTSLDVVPVDDGEFEENETVIVTLQPSNSDFILDLPSATVTIIGTVSVQFAEEVISAGEADGTASVSIVRIGDTDQEVKVQYATFAEGADSGADFTPTSGIATLAPGQSQVTITVPILDDEEAEGTEAFRITLSNPSSGISLGDPVDCTVRIVDDEIKSFDEYAGSYMGLMESTPAVYLKTGWIKVNLNKKGSYTASVRIGGRTHGVKGKFNQVGVAEPSALKKAPFNLAIQLDRSNPGGKLSVQLLDPSGADASAGEARRAVFKTRGNPVPEEIAGAYTVVLPVGQLKSGSAAPTASGYGSVKVSKGGVASFSGQLGDGTRAVVRGTLTDEMAWPFYAESKKGRSIALGHFLFRETANVSDVDGLLDWLKADEPESSSGFVVEVPAIGSRYVPPAEDGDRLLPLLESDSIKLTRPGGDSYILSLPPATSREIRKKRQTTSIESTLKITFSLSSGLFSGTLDETFVFLDGGSGGGTVRYKLGGAILQKSSSGGGYIESVEERTPIAVGAP